MKMVEATLDMVSTIDAEKYPSHVFKEYYDVARELASVILLLDGYKTSGEGAHRILIEHMAETGRVSGHEASLLDEMRKIRNRIAYDGLFIETEYLKRKRRSILALIAKLKGAARSQLS